MRCEYYFEATSTRCFWDSEDENAYHEAGHQVAAAAGGLPLLPEGILIYERADASKALSGYACYREGDFGEISHRDAVLTALIAGMRAQDREFPETAPHSSDENKLNDLLEHCGFVPTLERVNELCQQLLNQNWGAIEALATALLERPWEEVDEKERSCGAGRKKQLDGKSIATILETHGVSVGADTPGYDEP